MGKGSTKVLVKLLNEDRNRVEWVHVCYIDTKLYNKYIEHFDLTSNDLNATMSRWITEDFNLNMIVSRRADLEVLKALVKDYYRRVYPDIFQEEGNIDRQGWMRVFITRKMKEDLGPYYEE